MKKIIIFIGGLLLATVLLVSCVSLTGPSFDPGTGPAKYNVAGVWEVKLYCSEYFEERQKFPVTIEQNEKDLTATFSFQGTDLEGEGMISDAEDIWLGGVYKDVAKAELEGQIVPGAVLQAEGICIIQQFGSAEVEGTFTAIQTEVR